MEISKGRGGKKNKKGEGCRDESKGTFFVISSLWFPNALPERAILSSKLRIIQQ